MNNLNESLKKYKPDLRDISLKSYVGYLTALHANLNTERAIDDIEWMRDEKAIHAALDNKSDLGQRNILNALIVGYHALGGPDSGKDDYYTGFYAEWRDDMSQKYFDSLKEHGGVNPKQQKNMITREELDKVIDEQEKYVKFFKLKTKETLTAKELQQLQLYVLLRFHQVHPLRNDLASVVCMRQAEYNRVKEGSTLNVFVTDANKIVLNTYKTSKTYGQLIIEVEKPVATLLRLLIKRTPNESNHMLVKANGMPFSGNEYSVLLTGFFKEKLGKNVSTTLLRKVYLSKYSETVSKMADDAKKMGHSGATQREVYIPAY